MLQILSQHTAVHMKLADTVKPLYTDIWYIYKIRYNHNWNGTIS